MSRTRRKAPHWITKLSFRDKLVKQNVFDPKTQTLREGIS